MITNIKIENFRQFDLLELQGLKNFNVIVGYSNIGKTSILEAMWLAVVPEIPSNAVMLNRFRGGHVGGNIHSLKNLFRDLNFDNTIKISSTIDKEKDEFILEKSDSITFSNNGINPEIELKNTHKFNNLETKAIWQANNEKLIYTTLDNQIIPINQRTVHFFSDLIDSKHSPLNSDIDTIMKNSTQKANFLKYINYFENYEVEDFLINGQSDIDIKFKNNNLYIPLILQGQGFKKYFEILAAIVAGNISHFLIDELESGLHHSLFVQFLTTLIKLSKELGIQIICTSHSIEIIKTLNELMKRDAMDNYQDTLNIVRVAKTKKGYKSYNINSNALQDAIDTDWELRDA